MKNKIGFTLAEALIAVSIFATVAVVAGGIFVSIVQGEKKGAVQSVIYEDLKTILQQITYEIQHGTIDYDEYYNYYVAQNDKGPEDIYYGINYGAYGSRFYNPGQSFKSDETANPADLGYECSYPKTLAAGEKCDIIYTLSGDTNTGQNPYHTGQPGDPNNSANAFCDNGRGKCDAPIGETDHLFLIDNTGTKKTIISKKLISAHESGDDSAVGLVRMVGGDLDQNGVADTFSCLDEFGCFGAGAGDEESKLAARITLPLDKILGENSMLEVVRKENITVPRNFDLTVPFLNTGKINSNTSSFVPISPLRSTVKDLKFIINPLEDPYKAYAEHAVQSHPTVTIILTLGLSKKAAEDYPGEFRNITVRTAVAAGVIGRIDSYPPVTEVKGKNENGNWDQSWVDKIGTTIPIVK